ncbi:MAG: nitrous oxide reductase accessory protein NosL [Planctomycetales bacterium]|nr:nitrous oxide reductase accessory protein NosL [bacterium]UNM07795.1 MAG: nitrous oxide reductase accessory protein NosL [Planctomycetales bacterium]
MTDSHDETQEELFYEEAPRSSVSEAVGVFIALLALCIVGYGGYVWLTPGMELGDILRREGLSPKDGVENLTSEQGKSVAIEDERCPQCGMYSLRSIAAVHASFADGSSGYFDGWGCVANWATEHSTTLADAKTRDIASADRDPQWIDAASAAYRYGTDKLSGSMAPFVASYATPGMAADDARRGGEVMDYPALLSELGIAASTNSMGAEITNDPAKLDTAGEMQMDGAMESMDHIGHDHAARDGADKGMPAADKDSSTVTASGSLYNKAGFSDSSCQYCGMFADKSLTHVVVRWQDGSYTQHDSFDCVFNLMADEARSIDAIQFTAYEVDNPGSHWLDASTAWFLYDTDTVKGSMPPYVAGFASRSDAENAQAGLGGQLLDYNGLAAMWQQ